MMPLVYAVGVVVAYQLIGVSVTYDAVGVLRRGVVGQLERVWQELIGVSAAYQ